MTTKLVIKEREHLQHPRIFCKGITLDQYPEFPTLLGSVMVSGLGLSS